MLLRPTIAALQDALESGAHPKLARASRAEKQAWIEGVIREAGYADLNRDERGVVRAYIQAVTGYSRAQMTRYIGALHPKPAVIETIRSEMPRVGRFYGVVGLAALMLLAVGVSVLPAETPVGSLSFLNAEQTVDGAVAEPRSITVTTQDGGGVLFAMEEIASVAPRSPQRDVVAAATLSDLRLRVEARRAARLDAVLPPIGGRGERVATERNAVSTPMFDAIGTGLNGQVLTMKNGKIVWAYPNFTGTGRAPTPADNANDSDPSNDDRPARRGGGGGGGTSGGSTGGGTTTVIQTVDSDEWTDATGITYLTDLTQNVGIGTATPGAKLEVVGAISGTSLKLAGLANCNSIDTDAAGNLVCGTDEGGVAGSTEVGTASFSGAVLRLADARYVNQSGDTMTGALAIDLAGTNAGVGLEVIETISGSILFANRSLSTSGSLVWEETASGASLYVATSINGAGLVDCDLSTQALKWDAATGRFSCGTVTQGNWSGTGALQTAFDARYVNRDGDSMTGALTIDLAGTNAGVGLEVIETISGSVLYASRSLRSSGSLVWEGAASGASLYVATSINGAGLTDCDLAGTSKLLWDSATGRFSCGTDADTDTNTTYTAGDGLTLNGTSFSLNDTVTGALVRFGTVSGSTVYARSLLAASGSLAVEGTASIGGMLHVLDDGGEVRLDTGGSNGIFRLSFYDGTERAYIQNNQAAATFSIWTQNSFTLQSQDYMYLSAPNYVNLQDFATFTANRMGLGTASPDTLLEVIGTVSGSTLLGQHVRSSGSLAVDGTAYLNSSSPLKLTDAGFFGCTALETDADGDIVCGSDGGGSSYTAGQGLALNGTAISLNTTITGSLVRFQTLSGALVYAKNTLASSGTLVWEGAASGSSLYVASSFEGAGLTDCDLSSQTLQWDATTKRFSCGTDESSGSGLGQNEADLRYVNQSGDTMTGALTIDLASVTSGVGLEVIETISGSTVYAGNFLSTSGTLVVENSFRAGSNFFNLQTNASFDQHVTINGNLGINTLGIPKADLDVVGSISGTNIYANQSLYSSGSLAVDGTAYFNSSSPLKLADVGFFGCTALETDADGDIVCGSDGGGSSYTAGQGLSLNGTAISLNTTITGSLVRFQTLSGALVYAKNTLASSGSLVWEGAGSGASLYVASGIRGSGLADCDLSTNALRWDETTGRFSCGTITDTNTTYTAGKGLALNGTSFSLNDTVTGALVRFGTVSGSTVYARSLLAASGSLAVDGTAYLNSSAPLKLTDAGFFGCTALETDADGDIVCGSDGGGSTYTAGQGLTLNGTAISLNTTITGSLVRFQTLSGALVYAKNMLASSGSLVWEGAGSGSALFLNTLGVGIGSVDSGLKVEIAGTASGRVLYAQSALRSSGSLVWEGAGSGSSLYVGGDVTAGGLSFVADADSITFPAADSTNSPMVYMFASGNNNGDRMVLAHSPSFTNYGLQYVDTDDEFRFIGNGSTVLAIDTETTLRVGVLTSDPDTALDVVGTISGALVTQNGAGTNYFRGNVGIGTTTIDTGLALEVIGTASGRTLFANNALRSSGSLVWEGAGSGSSLFLNTLGVGIGSVDSGLKVEIAGTASGRVLYAQSALRSSGSLVWEGAGSGNSLYVAQSLQGAGLTDCDTAGSSKLLWDATTGRFSCGTDQTGGSSGIQNHYVLASGDTMTGALQLLNTSLNVTGSGTFLGFDTADVVLTVRGASGQTGNLQDWRDGDGVLVASVDAGGNFSFQNNVTFGSDANDAVTFIADVASHILPDSNNSFGLGNATNRWADGYFVNLSAAGNVTVSDSISTGGLNVSSSTVLGDDPLDTVTFNGGVVTFAIDTDVVLTGGTDGLSFDGDTLSIDADNNRIGVGTSAPDTALEVIGTISGSLLTQNGAGTNYFRGNLGIGTASVDSGLALEVVGTASGRVLYAQQALRSSGSLVVEGDVFLGDASSDTLTVLGGIASDLLPSANNTYALGNSTNRWSTGWFINANVSSNVSVLGTSSLTGNVGIGSANTTTKAALSVTGVASGTTLYATKSFSGAGLTDCDTAGSSKLLWDATTGRFSCGTDQTGGSSGLVDHYVLASGDTMTGALIIDLNGVASGVGLEVIETISGSTIFANNALRSSGSLVWEGAGSGSSLHLAGGNVQIAANGATTFNINRNPDAYFSVDGPATPGLLYVDPTNLRVGMLTNTPEYKLDVWWSGASDWVAKIGGTDASMDSQTRIGLGKIGAFNNGNSQALYLNPDGGNVSVNKTTNKAALDVLGTVSGSVVYVTDSLSGPNSTIDVAGHMVPTVNGFFTLGTNAKEWFQLYSNWGVFSSGLGIGTEMSSSQAKLEVAGTASGRVLFANDALRSSGALVWEGIGSGSRLTVSNRLSVGSGHSGSLLTVGRIGSGSTTATNATLFSVDQMGLGQLAGGAYLGRVGLTENQWALANYGNTWSSKDADRNWVDVAMSSDGKYQSAIPQTSEQIYVSSDYGETWTGKESVRNWRGIAMSADGKLQTAVVSTGQIYTSSDYGSTWTAKDSSRAWQGVAMSADGKIQSAVVSSGQIYVSTDYGNTWSAKDSSRAWRRVAMSADGKIQTASVLSGKLYVSTDYGNTWTAKATSQSWYDVAISSDGKIQLAVANTTNLYVSSDYGNTWTAKDSSRTWQGAAMSSDGRIQAATDYGGQIYVSTDYGATWTAKESNRNWYTVAMSSDGKVMTAGHLGGKLYVSRADSYQYGGVAIGTSSVDNGSGLEVLGTISGSVLRAQLTLASSGTLVWEGAGSGSSLVLAGGNFTMSRSGSTVFNENGNNVDLRMEGDTNSALFYLDASADRVGIGTATPKATLAVLGTISGSLITQHGAGINFFQGNVGIGTTGPSYKLELTDSQSNSYVARFYNTANSTTANGIIVGAGSNTTGGAVLAYFGRPDGSLLGYISQASATTVAYNTTSDARLKQNIVNSTGGLALLNRINVRDFDYVNDPEHHTQQGFIAQELFEIYPQAVSVGGDDPNTNPWGVDYGKLTPLIVKALQEVSDDVDALKALSGAYLTADDLLTSSGALSVQGFATFGSGMLLDTHYTNGASSALVIQSDVGGADNTVFRVNASGAVFTDEQYNSTGADYAEWFFVSTPGVQPGEVVCIDPAKRNTVKRCDRDADDNVMGIVSTNPAFVGNVINGAEGLPVPNTALVGLIGQVPAKVVVSGGSGSAIRPGDPLTAASKPGYARRARPGESTVGVALEGLDAGEGTVNVLISRRNQSLTVSAVEAEVLAQIQAMEIEDEIEIMVAEAMGDLNVDQSIIDEVTRQVDALNVQDAVALEVSRQVENLRAELLAAAPDAVPAASTGAAWSGGDLAASTLQLSASLSVEGDARIVGDLHLDGALVTNDLFVPGVLAVDGSLTATNADVTGDAAVHGTLTLHGPLVMGSGSSLQFGSGLTLADLVVERSLAVLGDVTVEGLATFLGDVAVEGELTVARQAGHLKVPLGATGATFRFDPPFAGTPVVTASPNKPVLYAVSVATSTGFVISLAEPAVADVTFSWVALVIPNDAASAADAPSGLVFPVDDRGVPVSSSLQWNACIRGLPLFDASGVPYSCSRYHDQNTWEHPDLGISFTWNDAVTPPYMVLPDGYASVVTESSESVRSAILDVNGIQAPREEGEAPADEPVEGAATGTGDVVEQPIDEPAEEPAVEPPAEEPVLEEQPVAEPVVETPVEPAVEAPAPVPAEPAPVVEVPEGEVVEVAPAADPAE